MTYYLHWVQNVRTKKLYPICIFHEQNAATFLYRTELRAKFTVNIFLLSGYHEERDMNYCTIFRKRHTFEDFHKVLTLNIRHTFVARFWRSPLQIFELPSAKRQKLLSNIGTDYMQRCTTRKQNTKPQHKIITLAVRFLRCCVSVTLNWHPVMFFIFRSQLVLYRYWYHLFCSR